MPRYFFHVRDGQNLPDDRGTEFTDLQAAQREAIAFAGRLIAESQQQIEVGRDWSLEVADERNHVLFRLDFRLSETPQLSAHVRPIQAVPPDA